MKESQAKQNDHFQVAPGKFFHREDCNNMEWLKKKIRNIPF